MEPASVHKTFPVEEDEWDTDGFVIPSLGIEEREQIQVGCPEAEIPEPPKAKEETTIYLGPHGAPPSQSKQDINISNRKQRLKQKLKEADRRIGSTGRENKLENLKELVGSGKAGGYMAKSSSKDWLDPHCHESQFDK